MQKNAIPIWKLCNTWIRIYRRLSWQQCICFFTLGQHDNSIIYFIPTIKDKNELNMLWTEQLKKLGNFLILPRYFAPLYESLYTKGVCTKQRCSRDRMRGLLSFKTNCPWMKGYWKPISLLGQGKSYVIKCPSSSWLGFCWIYFLQGVERVVKYCSCC